MASTSTASASAKRPETSPGQAARPSRWAAIDIGSDTIHLLVVDIRREGESWVLRPLRRRAMLLELGKEVAEQGEIRLKTVKELRRLVLRYLATAHKLQADVVLAATEACRSASNGAAALEEVSQAAGEPVRLLSGVREAELGFLAIRDNLGAQECQLVIDSGGASTEVSVTNGRARTASISLAVGASLIAGELEGPAPRGFGWVLEAATVGEALARLPAARPVRAFATGGSAHNLAGLEEAELGRQSKTLSLRDLTTLFEDLFQQPIKRIAKRSGEDPRRVRLLAPGALIVGAVLQHYRLTSCTVLTAGVREGMIIAANEVGDGWWQDQSAPSGA